METVIVVRFHHGGTFVFNGDDIVNYEGELVPRLWGIDVDHISLFELCHYTRVMGYPTVGGFYHQDPTTKLFKLFQNDNDLLNLIAPLKHEDIVDIFVNHIVINPIVVDGVVPAGFLPYSEVGDKVSTEGGAGVYGGERSEGGASIDAEITSEGNGGERSEGGTAVDAEVTSEGNGGERSEGGAAVDAEVTSEGNGGERSEGGAAVDAEVTSEGNGGERSEGGAAVDAEVTSEGDGGERSQGGAAVDGEETNQGGAAVDGEEEIEGDVEDFDEDLGGIPDEDDSDVDDELRFFRNQARQAKAEEPKRKKKQVIPDIELGEVGIDRGFEDIEQRKGNKYAGRLAGDEEYLGSSDIGSDDSRDELDPLGEDGVDLPARRISKKVRYDPSCEVSVFELDMIFENAVQFRHAIADYAVENKVQLKLRPNEKERVRAKCTNKKCKWQIYASLDRDTQDFKVKSYYPVHKCLERTKIKLCNTAFIARKLKDTIIGTPEIRVFKIQEEIRKKWGVHACRSICYRAKMLVINQFLGDWKMEFSKLCDYADIIKQSNPGSSCWIRTDKETEPGKNLFKYFYVCFYAMKQGWLEGCRKIIGFDGCFLKGVCKGELLVAVGKNGNNQMFPIAWAVVDRETLHSWSWFLEHLIADLELGQGDGLTVMSDMQKGLVPAIRDKLPNAEHRMCARHIWSNWAKNWAGEERRKQFWRCSKASFLVKLKEELDSMDKLGNEICESLLCYPKETWCKAYFRETPKCDIVENNMCETFNSWIVGPRHKSIISMLEEIRHKMMSRTVEMRKFPLSSSWKEGEITPMAQLILDENKKIARKCELRFNWDDGFEVKDEEYTHTVNMTNRTCSCRLWMLKGIACAHAICAIYHLGEEPESHIDHWYTKETFLAAYKYTLQPIPCMKMWPETANPSIDPPEVKPMPGRPKKCRRKEKTEPKKKYGKASKMGVKMTCSKCKETGHNKKGCRKGSEQARTQAGTSATQEMRQPAVPVQQAVSQPSAPPSSTQDSRQSSICEDTSRVRKTTERRIAASTVGTGRGRGKTLGVGRGRGAGRGRGEGPVVAESANSSNVAFMRGFGRGRGAGTVGAGSENSGNISAGRGVGRGRGAKRGLIGASSVGGDSASTNVVAKKPRLQGYGVYTDVRTGTTILNQGMPGARVLRPGKVVKHSADTVELGYEPTGLRWMGRKAITSSQLQQKKNAKKSAAASARATQ